jgi:snurportin-1
MLERQKSKRDDLVSLARTLAMGDFEEEAEEEEDDLEDMDTAGGEGKQRRLRKTYKNQLMLSEWLVEVPVDLETNWLLLLCPEGRRNFVIAASGTTKVFSKSGKQVKRYS